MLTTFIVALIAIMLALAAYVWRYYQNLGRIQAESDRYAELYGGRSEAGEPSHAPELTPTAAPTKVPTVEATKAPTEAPTQSPAATPSPTPTAEPTKAPAEAPTQSPTATPSPTPTEEPTATAELSQRPSGEATPGIGAEETPTAVPTETPAASLTRGPAPTPSPAPTPVAEPTPAAVHGDDMPIVSDEPIPTPGSDTLVVALPTAPPVQDSFDALLAVNPETVGFLDIEGMLSLPVVQRENDNDYYLSHSFEGAETQEGTLFLDGLNRLVPEDDCLIVYGHNMKNRTMFGKLDSYASLDYLKQRPVIRFDTIYEDRSYVVFAAFTASMESGDSRYFDVRQFLFDEAEFDKFVLKLQSRSRYWVPVEVTYGDRLLLLVTCDYTSREGRFILALRQLRDGETEADMWAQVMRSEAK